MEKFKHRLEAVRDFFVVVSQWDTICPALATITDSDTLRVRLSRLAVALEREAAALLAIRENPNLPTAHQP